MEQQNPEQKSDFMRETIKGRPISKRKLFKSSPFIWLGGWVHIFVSAAFSDEYDSRSKGTGDTAYHFS